MGTRPRHRLESDGASSRRGIYRRAAGRAGSLGLTVLSVLGAACIACILASVLFKVSFVVFRTGSMEPSYPVGALAAVREVPASSLKPGDVATVQRTAGSVPVTHRVVTVMPDAASADGAVLILKGDANTSEDPVEYRVQSARTMLFAVPELGSWVMGARSPWAIGGSTVLLAGLVGWVFWPRQELITSDGGSSEGGAAEPAGEVPVGTAALR
ncbi:signal peptidase I [Arthrobacter globiformis]|uniref:signal peptidase I n=1 Tax=Arthrobacter globiformis TaxID=1665 RepID=UPI00278E21DC|nr:signal peptidase I [Arthrobacter globiformis]MDQ0620081.1 signal peptidase [Arthrobacter globiformis]